MLYIHFGDLEGSIYNTERYFKNVYRNSWITDPFGAEIIQKVDGSVVLDGEAVRSRQLGVISPTGISGGAKTLLLIWNMPDKVFNATTCGDNCASLILQMASKRDVRIVLYHVMNFGKTPFEAVVENTGQTVTTMKELSAIGWDCLEASE